MKKLKTTEQKAKVHGKIDLLARAILICAVNLPAERSLLLLFFGLEDYLPELYQTGLDPAVQGVPFKKKQSVLS